MAFRDVFMNVPRIFGGKPITSFQLEGYCWNEAVGYHRKNLLIDVFNGRANEAGEQLFKQRSPDYYRYIFSDYDNVEMIVKAAEVTESDELHAASLERSIRRVIRRSNGAFQYDPSFLEAVGRMYFKYEPEILVELIDHLIDIGSYTLNVGNVTYVGDAVFRLIEQDVFKENDQRGNEDRTSILSDIGILLENLNDLLHLGIYKRNGGNDVMNENNIPREDVCRAFVGRLEREGVQETLAFLHSHWSRDYDPDKDPLQQQWY